MHQGPSSWYPGLPRKRWRALSGAGSGLVAGGRRQGLRPWGCPHPVFLPAFQSWPERAEGRTAFHRLMGDLGCSSHLPTPHPQPKSLGEQGGPDGERLGMPPLGTSSAESSELLDGRSVCWPLGRWASWGQS